MAVDVTVALPGGDPGRFLRNEPDDALVELAGNGNVAAFEAIYDRHHRGLIAFCRHMLWNREEAEDALQHTFAAAYRALTCGGERPKALKPWLYTIARNRCLTVLRARRTRDVVDADAPADGAVVEGLADAVQRRTELRELVDDLHRLPEDQRAALVLFELGDHSHAEIAAVLAVDRTKVKALVFQAREGLLRARTARDTPCAEIRKHLSSRTRALPRRGVIRGHLEACPACAAFDLEVRRQRAALALVMPVVPSLELKGSVLGPLLGGGATVASGGAVIAGGGAGAGIGASGTSATAGLSAASAGTGVSAGAGGAALGTGAASGIAGAGAAAGALAAKAVVAKVVAVVAVAGAAAGGTAHHAASVQHAAKPPRVISARAQPTVVVPAASARGPVGLPATTALPAPTAGTAAPAVAAVSAATAVATSPATTTTTSSGAPAASTPATSTPTANAPSTPATNAPSTPNPGGAATTDAPAAGTNAPAAGTNAPTADQPAAPAQAADPTPAAPAGTAATPAPAADPTPVSPSDTAAPATADPALPGDPSATELLPECPAPVDPTAPAPVDATAPAPDPTVTPAPDPCADAAAAAAAAAAGDATAAAALTAATATAAHAPPSAIP